MFLATEWDVHQFADNLFTLPRCTVSLIFKLSFVRLTFVFSLELVCIWHENFRIISFAFSIYDSNFVTLCASAVSVH